MRKFLGLLVMVAVVFLVWNRQRLYVRDPLGSVMRDGVKEKGAQVYINFANDALVENYNAPMYMELVQQGGRVGTPALLHCVAYVACLLDADRATLLEDGDGGKVASRVTPKVMSRVTSMSNKQVVFRDAQGRDVVVTLR